MQYKILKNCSYFSKFQVKKRRSRQNKSRINSMHKNTNFKSHKIYNKNYKVAIRVSNLIIQCLLLHKSILGDIIINRVDSRDLFKFGLITISKNIITAFFLGILLSKITLSKFKLYKTRSIYVVSDVGFKSNFNCSKIYFLLRGLIEGGLEIHYSTRQFRTTEDFLEEYKDNERYWIRKKPNLIYNMFMNKSFKGKIHKKSLFIFLNNVFPKNTGLFKYIKILQFKNKKREEISKILMAKCKKRTF